MIMSRFEAATRSYRVAHVAYGVVGSAVWSTAHPVQRRAVSPAPRPVVGGGRARGRPLGFEGPHRDDRRARFQARLQRGNSLHVKPDPTELHRRYIRVTSSTASITSATSWSDMRALSGRLSIRSKLPSATGKRCGA